MLLIQVISPSLGLISPQSTVLMQLTQVIFRSLDLIASQLSPLTQNKSKVALQSAAYATRNHLSCYVYSPVSQLLLRHTYLVIFIFLEFQDLRSIFELAEKLFGYLGHLRGSSEISPDIIICSLSEFQISEISEKLLLLLLFIHQRLANGVPTLILTRTN